MASGSEVPVWSLIGLIASIISALHCAMKASADLARAPDDAIPISTAIETTVFFMCIFIQRFVLESNILGRRI